MARVLIMNCCPSLIGGSYSNSPAGGGPSAESCSGFLLSTQKKNVLIGRNGSCYGPDHSSTTLTFSRRRKNRSTSLGAARQPNFLQFLQCRASRTTSRSSTTSPRRGAAEDGGISVAERRSSISKNSEPWMRGNKSGNADSSLGRGVEGQESLGEENGSPNLTPLVFRSNSRHTHQTGAPREVSQKPEAAAGSRKDVASGGALISDTSLGCEHFPRCSGCVLENALDRPPVLHDAVQFFKSYGISDFSLNSGSLWEWRCRAKLAVRGTSENPVIGLYEEGSHISVDIPNCRTHHPRINAAVELLKEAIKALRVEPYNEESGSGHLRYVQMVVTTHNTSMATTERYANGKVQISLVWNARDEKSAEAKFLQPMAEFLWRKGRLRCPEPILHSIWVNFQTSRTNIIFGGKWRHLLGEQEMWERIAGADICFTPASFGQANLQAFEALLRKLQTHVRRGSAVVELYAGVGVIGISLAATRGCRSVKCIEVNKESRTSFQLSLSRVPESVKSKISWHCADASLNPIYWLKASDTVVVDPPRKGLDPSVIEALRTASLRDQGKLRSSSPTATAKVEKRPWVVRANQGVTRESSGDWEDAMDDSWPSTLIYVSCGWQSFKKDCAALVENNAWHLEEACAFNFFPGTDSIEVLAVFKSGKKKKSKVGKKKVVGKKVSFKKKVIGKSTSTTSGLR
ncbi:unnamed protein product [Calypogeia fissa]